ncbi:4Fe-4S binding protein [Eggerthella guodeyinii]|uniref:4Fe-4S binding protein n=1 Tax=Eggerthella guodeyinii TaxID=2690837 RepID=A0A6L7ING0_9ACTN|nr:4Fe-4S binding protein [Eggerthella guodeyinii]QOS68135.1 4Fe-4S binding protein [Eggerthella guodeyinii]
MPNLIDIAQRLAEQPAVALLHEERCLPERDLGSSCARCAEACPVDAIAVGAARGDDDASATAYGSVTKDGPTGPRIDDEACVRCGRCITACPTAALLANAPLDDDALLDASAQAGAAARLAEALAGGEAALPLAPRGNDGDLQAPTAAQGRGVRGVAPQGGTPPAAGTRGEAAASAVGSSCGGFVCERAVRGGARIDAERTVTLPCLAWVDEALIVHMACAGAQRIALLTAPCASCEHAAAVDALPQAADAAQRILDTWQLDAVVSIVDAVDDVAAPDDEDAAGEVSRRGLFSQARSALVEAATDAASAQIDALAGRRAADAPAPEPDRRRWQLLDDLHAAGLPSGDAVVPRALAPRVDIDAERCSGCALCAGFCPTQALRKAGKAAGGRTLLEFDAALCRDCGTCTDTCRYEAISREETLTVSELFALEPRAIVIPKRRVLPSRR